MNECASNTACQPRAEGHYEQGRERQRRHQAHEPRPAPPSHPPHTPEAFLLFGKQLPEAVPSGFRGTGFGDARVRLPILRKALGIRSHSAGSKDSGKGTPGPAQEAAGRGRRDLHGAPQTHGQAPCGRRAPWATVTCTAEQDEIRDTGPHIRPQVGSLGSTRPEVPPLAVQKAEGRGEG